MSSGAGTGTRRGLGYGRADGNQMGPVQEIEMLSLAFGGDGVGRLEDGRAVFVPGTCPGDRAAVTISEEHSRWARGTLEEVLVASPDRVVPPCPYAGLCGGCQWQHIGYERQLQAKRQSVADALVRIGGLDDPTLVSPCAPSSRQLGYRNKIELVAEKEGSRLILGYHRLGSSEVVPVDRCLLLPPSLQDAPRRLRGALSYVAGRSPFELSRVGVRAAARTSDLEVALWAPPGAAPRSSLASTLGASIPLTSLVRVLFKGPLKERHVGRVEVLSGRGYWREEAVGHVFGVSAPSFFQVNTEGAETLVDLALRALDADGSDTVLDVFAGVGTFTLPLAEVAGDVTAVESSGPAIRDMRRNLDESGLFASVMPGDAARVLADVGRFDLALVDPPRSGLSKALLLGLEQTRSRRLVYVSCDPATLARDARLLGEAGYRLSGAHPVDLFPQSFHVETVTVFDRL